MGKYLIDNRNFSTIEKAKTHVRDILKSVGICKSVKQKNTPVFNRLSKFLARHNDAIRKGVTDVNGNNLISDIEIRHNLKGDLEVCFTKEDGFTTEDISWVRCINPKEKTHWQKLCSAMRSAIQEQIQEIRVNNPQKKSQASPCRNEDADYSHHVDHKIPFKKLQLDFLIKDFDDLSDTNEKKIQRDRQRL